MSVNATLERFRKMEASGNIPKVPEATTLDRFTELETSGIAVPEVTNEIDSIIHRKAIQKVDRDKAEIEKQKEDEAFSTEIENLKRQYPLQYKTINSMVKDEERLDLIKSVVEQTVNGKEDKTSRPGAITFGPYGMYPQIPEVDESPLNAPLRGFGRNLPLAATNILRFIGTFTPPDFPLVGSEDFREAADFWRTQIMKIPVPEPSEKYARGPRGLEEWVEPMRIWNSFWENAPLTAALGGAYILNPAVGTALMAAVEGGASAEELHDYEKQTGEKLPEIKRRGIPIIVGAFNAALERTGIESILGKGVSRKIRSRLLKALISAGTEGTTEGMQEIVSVIGAMGYNPEASAEVGERLLQSFYGGIVTGGILGGVIPDTGRERDEITGKIILKPEDINLPLDDTFGFEAELLEEPVSEEMKLTQKAEAPEPTKAIEKKVEELIENKRKEYIDIKKEMEELEKQKDKLNNILLVLTGTDKARRQNEITISQIMNIDKKLLNLKNKLFKVAEVPYPFVKESPEMPPEATKQLELTPTMPETEKVTAAKPGAAEQALLKPETIEIGKRKYLGMQFSIVRTQTGQLELQSIKKKDTGEPLKIVPYTEKQHQTYLKRSESGRKAMKTRFKDKILLKPNQITSAMAIIRKYGNYKGEAEFFDGVIVGKNKLTSEAFAKKTLIDKTDSAVDDYNEYSYHYPEENLGTVESYDDIMAIAQQDFSKISEGKTIEQVLKERLEKERYGGYTKEEAEAMEADYNESIKESEHAEEDIERTYSNASELARSKILRTEGKEEVDEETFNEAIKFFEEKAKPPVKLTLKADKTTALFDTKDSRTGKPIKAGEPIYHLIDTDETIKVSTYEEMVKRPEQGKIFKEEPAAEKVEKQPWEMTIDEYDKHILKTRYFTPAPGSHESYVQKALLEGKPVTAEVLKDYPELGKAPKEAPTSKELAAAPYSVKAEPQLTMIPKLEGKVDMFEEVEKEPAPPVTEIDSSLRDIEKEYEAPENAFKEVEPGPDREDSQAARVIAKAFGQEVVFIQTEHPEVDIFNGVTHKGRIYLNNRSDNHHIAVLGHELSHRLRQEESDLYNQLIEVINEDPEAFQKYKTALVGFETDLTKDPFGFKAELTDTQAMEEFVGNTVGERMSEPEFWRNIHDKSPDLVKKIYEYVQRVIRKLKLDREFNKAYGTSQYFKDIEKVRDTIDTVMAEYGGRARLRARAGKRIAAQEKIAPAFQLKLYDSLELEPETRLQYLQRLIQDKLNRLNFIQKKIGKISEKEDVYLKAELFIGRASDQIERFQKDIIDDKKSFLKRLTDSGFTVDEFGAYLYALHAKERNAHIQKVNVKFKEGGSGLTDEEANAILKKFEDSGIDEFTEEFYEKTTKAAMKIRLESGLIDEKTFNKLSKTYKNYVPLKGTADIATYRTIGKGFSVTGKDIKRARGRRSLADNPFVQALIDYEDAVIRAEKNKVAQTLLKLIAKNPSEVWKIESLKYVPVYDNTGEIQYMDPKYKYADNIIEAKVEGKIKLLTIKDKALVEGIKNLGVEKGIKLLMNINAYLRAVNTIYNPEFMITNFERDLQTAMIHLTGEQSAKMAAKVLKDIRPAMQGIWGELRGKDRFMWSKYYRELKAAGGKVGWFDQRTLEQKTNSIERKARLFKKGKSPFRLIVAAGKFVSDANEMVESGVRLAAYKNLREAGVSKERAAQAAKNLTVNFNKKGNIGAFINSAWLFSNAGIQGTARIFKAMGVPFMPKTRGQRRVQKIVAGMVAVSFIQSVVNRYTDEDNWEQFSDYNKDNFWLFMLPNGKTFAFKLPYGYNIFHVLGIVAEEMVNGNLPLGDAARRLFSSVNDAFNPLGGGSLAQFISPTAFDPLIQLGENKNFFGGPIRPEQPKFQPKKPRSTLYFKSVRQPTKAFTDWLNRITGGDEKISGMIDISPEDIDHLLTFVSGGTGRFILNSIETGKSLLQEGDFPDIRNVPVMRQFLKEPSEWTSQKIVYRMIDDSDRKRFSEKEKERFKKALNRAKENKIISRLKARELQVKFNRNQRELTKAAFR